MGAWVYTGELSSKRIREKYLRSILRQDVAFFDNLGAGEVATRIQTGLSSSSFLGAGIMLNLPLSRHSPYPDRYQREGRNGRLGVHASHFSAFTNPILTLYRASTVHFHLCYWFRPRLCSIVASLACALGHSAVYRRDGCLYGHL